MKLPALGSVRALTHLDPAHHRAVDFRVGPSVLDLVRVDAREAVCALKNNNNLQNL